MAELTPSTASSTQTYDMLFAEARGRLLRICIGLVGSADAEDIVHDTYLRGRRSFGGLRDTTAFDAWLTRIAVNQCLSSRRRERSLAARLPALARSSAGSPPDTGLVELIEALPIRERAALVLFHGYGYGLDEIARLLGTSHTNARTIVFRARRHLASLWLEADR